MALRTYQKKINRLTQSVDENERTLWEAVLDYLRNQEKASRKQVLEHFARDEPQDVAAVFRDLASTGLIQVTGRCSTGLLWACTLSHQPSLDKNTNWLTPCERDSDCQAGDCLCGLCTLRCQDDASCEGLPAPSRCFDRTTEAFNLLCAECEERDLEGLCLPSCETDRDCHGALTCASGSCLPAERVEPDGSASAGGATAETGRDDLSAPEGSATGVWIGELDLAPERSCIESRQIEITLQPGPDPGSARGTVLFGEGALLPPPSDPDQGYPPGDTAVDVSCRVTSPSLGFPYTLLDGRLDPGGRFRFRVAPTEFYRDWCELQTPLGGWAPFDYTCARLDAESEIKETLCDTYWVCVCFEEGCVASMENTTAFDLLVDGPVMEGLVTFPLFDPQPTRVRLRRVE